MIPFELSRFDGGLSGAGVAAPQGRVADRIMEVAKVRKRLQAQWYWCFYTTGHHWTNLCELMLSFCIQM